MSFNGAVTANVLNVSASADGSLSNVAFNGVVTANVLNINAADMSMGADTTGTVDIWISNDSNPTFRQMKTDATVSGTESTETVTFSKFNEDLNIPNPGQ